MAEDDDTQKEEITYDLALLEQSARQWERSPALRFVYGELYETVKKELSEGPLLEIGSGIGVSRDFFEEVVTSDIVKTPYVDLGVSAYEIPPGEGDGWGNICAIDVLHHLMRPMEFFSSAAAVLRPGGRIILIEPAATPFGCLFYRLFHHEPIQPRLIDPPFEFAPNGPDDTFANMGMGVGMFQREAAHTAKHFAESGLKIRELRFRDLLAYPLSGGYSKPSFLPAGGLRVLMRMESWLPQCLMRLLGLRMVIVLEKSS